MPHLIAENFVWPESSQYQDADPFPHIVMDNLWEPDHLDAARREVEALDSWEGEKNFQGSVAKRWQSQWEHLPKHVTGLFHFLASPEFLAKLEAVTGETGLIPDPYLEGGGIHSTGRNGFLKLHADFNWHSKMSLYRRLNILIYLNKDWDDSFNGQLSLARKMTDGSLEAVQRVSPIFNRTVIFTTDDHSFHGQPEPLATPDNVRRNSLASYYYVAAKPDGTSSVKRTNTDYRSYTGETLIKKRSLLDRVRSKVGR